MRGSPRLPRGPRFHAARHRERVREFAPPELIDVEAEAEEVGEEDSAEVLPRALRLVGPTECASESGA